MKVLKINWYFLVVIILTLNLGLTSCDDDDDTGKEDPKEETNTIVDIASSDATFSILVEALTKADLVSALSGSTEYTVFAPTNTAFEALLSELGASSLDDISKDELTKILLYHVVAGANSSTVLSTGYYPSISEKEGGYYYSIYFNKEDLMLNGAASITQADVMADNGYIHIIDAVMLPPSITDHAIANPALSSLTAAVVKAELATTLDDDENNFTVFAPTDDAFEMLFEDLDVTLDDLSKEALTPILLYHVVNAFVPAAQVTSGYVSALAMGQDNYLSANIDVSNSTVMLNKATVVLTDVVATNGIVHVIDQVLMPNTVVDLAMNNTAFSILVEAVVKAELAETLSGEGPFTVFAPTNAAFEALFATLNVNGIEDLSKETLTPILLAHVVSGNVRSSDLSNGSVPTLNTEKDLTIDISSKVMIDGDISVIIADVQGTNGVVHAIDKVIVP
ncbi:fasciclin domain-containing protein [Saccharicrinis fermentans]|uniref:Lipoprotein p23 n=1 Tax=Saccharicrinis fermentans DSM 9555 = JCM 21142 TaxID=869213 RepID=W7YJA0_9BACT|nr:fasciclin domain-containing protein [Saccharicrinis fermentans]GAF04561.1 lipoprotein p23 [Saccharicrinis fermentans DSM 9555 = JCM 21142]